MSQGNSEYDALEKDLSHVNIFFGNDHCMGELSFRIRVGLSFFCVRLVVCANLRQGPDMKKGRET